MHVAWYFECLIILLNISNISSKMNIRKGSSERWVEQGLE